MMHWVERTPKRQERACKATLSYASDIVSP